MDSSSKSRLSKFSQTIRSGNSKATSDITGNDLTSDSEYDDEIDNVNNDPILLGVEDIYRGITQKIKETAGSHLKTMNDVILKRDHAGGQEFGSDEEEFLTF